MPDHPPIEVNVRPELMDRLIGHYKVADSWEVCKALDAANCVYASPQAKFPAWEKRVNGTMHDRPAVLRDARTYEDPWGIVQRLGSDGKYEEWISGPLVDTDDLDSLDWPDERCIVDAPALPDKVRKLKAQGYWVVGNGGVHPFKQAWHMRGFENFLCDYMANPDWVEAYYDRILRFNLACCRRSAQVGVDMIEYWGDVAMQDRMIVPPDQWRRLDKPMWTRLILETRKIKPDMKFFFHSDGDVRPIIGDIIEAGFDILNPLQPECVNPGLIKKQWGDRITLDGGGSVQRTLPLGSVEDVRREVDFLMKTCAYDGGYIFRPSNVAPYDCPLENIITFFEMSRDYDFSKIQGPPAIIPDPPCMAIRTFPGEAQRLD
jgi:hypothetical protein